MLTLRPAAPDDVAVIADVWYRGWGDGHLGHVPERLLPHRDAASFLRRVPERLANTTLASIDGRSVGFVTLCDDELEQLYVDASARGSGVAVMLIRHAERTIGERFERAWLAVATGNARARRFYAREGWADVGAFDYLAQVEGGTIAVPSHRYEKHVAPASREPG
jgi:GNAT superfamily N-acetyltransferase